MVVGLAGSLIELALYAFVGRIVDMMKDAKSPETFVCRQRGMLLFWAFVALILRPVISTAHDLFKQQTIAGAFTTRIRWQTHRYVLRQSLGFFQNDFAGRIGSKVMQTGTALRESVVQVTEALWFAAVQWIGALLLFAEADWRLTLPLIGWLVLYGFVLKHFVPRIKELSYQSSEARSVLNGRIIDSYTNIQTVKLFAHATREDEAARAVMEDHLDKYQRGQRNLTQMELALYTINGLLLVVGDGARDQAVVERRGDDRRGGADDDHRDPPDGDVGLDPVDGRRHLREPRHRAGGHGDDRAAQRGARRARRQAAGGDARARSASRASASTTARSPAASSTTSR